MRPNSTAHEEFLSKVDHTYRLLGPKGHLEQDGPYENGPSPHRGTINGPGPQKGKKKNLGVKNYYIWITVSP